MSASRSALRLRSRGSGFRVPGPGFAGGSWGEPETRNAKPGTPAWRRHRWARWAARAALVAAAAGAAWAGARAARAMPWGYFRVSEVAVEGNLHLGREDVLATLDLPPGASLLTLNLAALGARLAADPWVSEATVQRRLPDRLVVRLVERAPAAVLLSEAAHLVSGDGVILGEAEPEALAALPVLRAPAGLRYQVGDRVAPQELNEALRAWRQVQLAPVLAGRRPREVAVMRDGSYVVRLAPEPLTVRLRLDGLEAQLKRLGAVVALRGGALEDVEEVDLRFREKVLLRPRTWQGPGARDQGPVPTPDPARMPAGEPQPPTPMVDLRPVSARERR